MICPSCGYHDCVRSQRKGLLDGLATIATFRPWRCMKCKRRFYARRVAWDLMRHTNCPRCGNLELRHITNERVEKGGLRWLFRLLGVPAYRCDPCRMKFFSVRSLYRPHSEKTQATVDYSADG